MTLSREELARIAASIGPLRGWDLSLVRDDRGPVPWNYPDVARRYLRSTDRVLDVGTGGGEVFLGLASIFREGIGVDVDPRMAQTAIENAWARSIANVAFETMPAQDLRFAEASFDVVLNRHSAVFVDQVVPVLRPGGYFVTQQVGERNTQAVFSALGWGSNGEHWRRYWDAHGFAHQDVRSLAAQFRQAGCAVEAIAEYDVPYRFLDVESLVAWLTWAPLPEDFDVDRHWKAVSRLVSEHADDRGIVTNEHRELLVARKPAP